MLYRLTFRNNDFKAFETRSVPADPAEEIKKQTADEPEQQHTAHIDQHIPELRAAAADEELMQFIAARVKKTKDECGDIPFFKYLKKAESEESQNEVFQGMGEFADQHAGQGKPGKQRKKKEETVRKLLGLLTALRGKGKDHSAP